MKEPDAPIIYNLFPRLAGPFRLWERHLERAAAMGCNWIFINPIHACGFSGSMYAIQDYYRIDPRYLDPDSRSSEEAQFITALECAHRLGLRVMMDLVINHTASDSVLVKDHPLWYKRDKQGSILHPQAPDTGEVWGDLAAIDNVASPNRESLWRYWEDLIEHYLGYGLDGFRCDAAYQVPVPLWERILARARNRKPGTLFFAETLGCDFKYCIALACAGFDYNFNSSKWWDFQEPWALEQYEQNRRKGSPSISFPESHDTARLAAELDGNVAAVKMRYEFASLFSTGVMMPLGFEYCFTKRLNVVHTVAEDWEPERCDLTGFIRSVHARKAARRVFCEEGPAEAVRVSNPRIFVMKKASADGGERALIIINTDVDSEQRVRVGDVTGLLGGPRKVRDLSLKQALDQVSSVYETRLMPAQVAVLYGED